MKRQIMNGTLHKGTMAETTVLSKGFEKSGLKGNKIGGQNVQSTGTTAGFKIERSSSYVIKPSFVTQTNKLVSRFLVSSSYLSPSQCYSCTKEQIKSILMDNFTSIYEEKSVLFLSEVLS